MRRDSSSVSWTPSFASSTILFMIRSKSPGFVAPIIFYTCLKAAFMFAASWGTTSSLFTIFLPRPGAALRPAGAPARAKFMKAARTIRPLLHQPARLPAAPGWSRGIKVSKVGPLFPKSRSRSSATPHTPVETGTLPANHGARGVFRRRVHGMPPLHATSQCVFGPEGLTADCGMRRPTKLL